MARSVESSIEPSAQKPKVAIVTGGSSGIGLELCKILRQDGYETYSFDKVAPKGKGDGIIHIACDITSSRTVDAALALVRKPIDLLVNNAGILRKGKINGISEAAMRELLDVNIMGSWIMMTRTEPHLSSGATMLQLSSFRAFRPRPGVAVYGLTKQFSMEMAGQYIPDDPSIIVKVALPGPVDTPMLQNDLGDRYEEVKRISITPAEMARKIRALLHSDFDMLVYDDPRERGQQGKGSYFLENFEDSRMKRID
jgi:3-oxoacyl-[acyl-carrier protein] reductase